MIERIGTLWRDEGGQDLIEYSLLIAFIALGCIAFFMGAGSGTNAVADEGSEILSRANQDLQGS